MYINSNYPPFQYQQDTICKLTEICQLDGGCLISDSTGLGKSITATYTTKNLVSDTDKVLVVAPSATIPEWKNYMKDFNIDAEVCTYAKPATGNYSVVIVDEADHYKECKTEYVKLFRIIRSSRVNGRMPYVMLLTATPVQNSIKQFKCMLSLIQFKKESVAYHILPQLFHVAESYSKDLDILLRYHEDGYENGAVMVKTAQARDNIKKSLKNIASVLPLFTSRNTRQSLVENYPNDMKMIGHFPIIESINHETNYTDETQNNIFLLKTTLGRMKFPLYNKAHYLLKSKYSSMTGIAQTTLLKRLDSSIHAFKQTLDRMCQTLKKELSNPSQTMVLDDVELPINTEQFISDMKADLHALEYLKEKWSYEDDAVKLQQLFDIVKDGQKTVIFTEYVETYDLIMQHLKDMGVGRIIGFNSDTLNGDKVLQTIKDNFDANNIKANDFDILVCTDALSAGVNLHQANRVIHFDVRWNPNRIIQRNGRVDRIMKNGSKDKVMVHTLYTNSIVEAIIGLQKTIESKEWLAENLLDFSNPMQLQPLPIDLPVDMKFGGSYSYEWEGGMCSYTQRKYANTTKFQCYKTNRGWLLAEFDAVHDCTFNPNQATVYNNIVDKINGSGYGLQNPKQQKAYVRNPTILKEITYSYDKIGEEQHEGLRPIVAADQKYFISNHLYDNGIEALKSEHLKKAGYKSKSETWEQFHINQAAKKSWLEMAGNYFLPEDSDKGSSFARAKKINTEEPPHLNFISVAIGNPFESSNPKDFPAKSFEYFEQFKGMEHPPQMESLFKYIPKSVSSHLFEWKITDFDIANNKMKITYTEYKKESGAVGYDKKIFNRDIVILLSIVKQDFGMYEYSFECEKFKKNMLEHSLEFAIKQFLGC